MKRAMNPAQKQETYEPFVPFFRPRTVAQPVYVVVDEQGELPVASGARTVHPRAAAQQALANWFCS